MAFQTGHCLSGRGGGVLGTVWPWAAPGHLEVEDKQALREKKTVELPGHPATSLYSPLSLHMSGGTQVGTGLS